MPLALPLVQWVRTLGPYPRHDCLLAYSEELPPEDREAVAAVIRGCGWKSPARAMQCAVPVQRWPDAPNAIFRQVADMIAGCPDFQRPWYFMEPDCTPMRKGWADEIADAYNVDTSKPFMGVIDNTYLSDTNTGELLKIGEHLCGTSVYPAALSRYTQRHRNCDNAFDIAIAKDIRPHARRSPLFQDNWSTSNYRRENGKIVCSGVTLRVALSGQSLARDVRPEAAVVHGCKDGSLLKLIDAEYQDAQNCALQPQKTHVKAPERRKKR